MTDLAMIDVVGTWLGIFLTMSILSFLYGDNPFYKLAEHLFIGVSIGYIVVVQFRNNFWVKWERGLAPWDVIPIALIAMMFLKFASKKLVWLGRFPLAFVVALYAGQSITGLVGSDLGDQITTASRPLIVYDASNQIDWSAVLSQVLLLVALLTGLLYFYFSIAHRGAIGRVSRVGVWILMIGFGASFGWTVQGRIALAIARAQDVRGTFMSSREAAQVHGELAAVVSSVIIIAGIYLWERRRAGAKPSPEAS